MLCNDVYYIVTAREFILTYHLRLSYLAQFSFSKSSLILYNLELICQLIFIQLLIKAKK